ncbi:MAG: hypothetical protein U5K84_04885 [Alkalibacterium sp.]|nr:hypothetical protein [Alkalibacterium sp.]
MKKLTKLLALMMTGGMLLVGCGDVEDVDENDLPEVEDPFEEDLEEDLELDEETDE